MKRLTVLGIVTSLFLLCGCQIHDTQAVHEVICFDPVTHQQTFDISTPHGIYAFVVEGYPVLGYRRRDGKIKVIPLAKNDCWIY